jgi:hypothetical protein
MNLAKFMCDPCRALVVIPARVLTEIPKPRRSEWDFEDHIPLQESVPEA